MKILGIFLILVIFMFILVYITLNSSSKADTRAIIRIFVTCL